MLEIISSQQDTPHSYSHDGKVLARYNREPLNLPTPLSPSFRNDEVQWAQLLGDLHPDADFHDQNKDTGGQICTCFNSALTAIRELSGLGKLPAVDEIARLLQVSNNALNACEQFSNCSRGCHQNHVLLFTATLQQLDTMYASLAQQMNASDWDGHASTMKVAFGSFEVDTTLDSDIGRAFLISERARVSSCAAKLAERFQLYVKEGGTDETRCQQEILSSLANNDSNN